MPTYLPDSAERHALDGISPTDALEMFAADARRFPRQPLLNLAAAKRNAQSATAMVRYLLTEKPAASFLGRDFSKELAEWHSELAAWRAVRREARALVRRCADIARTADEWRSAA